MRMMALLLSAALAAAGAAFAEGVGSDPGPDAKPVRHIAATTARKPKPATTPPVATVATTTTTPTTVRAPVPVAAKALPPLATAAPAPAPPTMTAAAQTSVAAGGAVSAPLVVTAPQALTDWRALDPENTLVIDTDRGRVVVELRPEFAPLAVARVKRLARSHIYDGLLFHRVIEGFAAQTGDPNNMDGGKSLEPDLPAEFTFRLGAEIPRAIVARPQGETEGFIGAAPYVSVDEQRMAMSPDRRVSARGAFCAGVMGMGHDADPDSANSEVFFLRDTARSLDGRYAAVGRVVMGLEVIRTLPAGDPPSLPARMRRVRVMADLPDPERPKVYVLNTLSPQFWGVVAQRRAARGADFSICDVEPPVKVVSAGDEAQPAAAAPRRRRRVPPQV
jgi:peptidylprolyl isomerase